MSKEHIQNAVNKLPQLTYNGVTYNRKMLSRQKFDEKFSIDRELLLNSEQAFLDVCRWLSDIKKIKTINRNHTSYGLKQILEKDIGHVSNGVFIAAAIHCGFDFKHDDSPNVFFNMSEKSIKEKDREKEPFLVP